MTTSNTTPVVNAPTSVVKGSKIATVRNDALKIVFPNDKVRAGFTSWLAANATTGNTMFTMDNGHHVDRMYTFKRSMSLAAEREVRTGHGFSYTDDAGKVKRTNLYDIGVKISRCNTVESLLQYPTITQETSVEARYDVLFGRKAATPKGKPGRPVTIAKPVTVKPVKPVKPAKSVKADKAIDAGKIDRAYMADQTGKPFGSPVVDNGTDGDASGKVNVEPSPTPFPVETANVSTPEVAKTLESAPA